jgi:hypothetical protein
MILLGLPYEEPDKLKKKHNTNTSQLAFKSSKAQSRMAALEWYKELCESIFPLV